MSTSSVLSSYTPRLPVRPFWDWLRRLTFVKGVKRVSVAAGSAHKVWTNATALSSKQVRPRYEENVVGRGDRQEVSSQSSRKPTSGHPVATQAAALAD